MGMQTLIVEALNQLGHPSTLNEIVCFVTENLLKNELLTSEQKKKESSIEEIIHCVHKMSNKRKKGPNALIGKKAGLYYLIVNETSKSKKEAEEEEKEEREEKEEEEKEQDQIVIPAKCVFPLCEMLTSQTTYCKQHLEETYHVEVKKSTIEAAGLGLYTTKDRKRGEVIVPYVGDIIDARNWAVENSQTIGGDYVLELAPAHVFVFIDATHPIRGGAGRFANSIQPLDRQANPKLKNNCEFHTGKMDYSANIVATKGIAKGEEIFVHYGQSYWKIKELNESSVV
jgi:hypothetical protein